MRRIALILTAILCASAVAIVGLGASSDDDGGGDYKVRAIFDSAFSVIKGEDVRVAGVTVGAIDSLDVTKDNKAAVILDITKSGFADFRRDATCEIRPQSLIGERFVECTPTQPRPPGTNPPPALRTIPDGQPGAGQHLLPITQTGQQVDIDLLNNIQRLPYRERFAIILNEFGTALAGNGAQLNSAIRRANPALRETDRVLAILASQNRVLADLARDSDTDLAPLADRRRQVADFVVQANHVAQATAERSAALEEGFRKFPIFLRELKPTLARLGSFADTATPVVTDLRAEAPALGRFAAALGPFSNASIPAIESLGKAAEVGKVAVPKTLPITQNIAALAKEAKPLSSNLRLLLESLRDTGGIEGLMNYVFFQVAAVNGFDTAGHYLRAGLIVNTCSTYVTAPTSGCQAKFGNGADAQAQSASARAARLAASKPGPAHPTGDKDLDRAAKVLALIGQGVNAQDAVRQVLGTPAEQRAELASETTSSTPSQTSSSKSALKLPAAVLPSRKAQAAARQARTPRAAAADAGGDDATGRLLDYLLGGDS